MRLIYGCGYCGLQRTPASSSIRMHAAQVGVLDRMRQLKRVQLPLLRKANSVCGWYAMLHGRCQLCEYQLVSCTPCCLPYACCMLPLRMGHSVSKLPLSCRNAEAASQYCSVLTASTYLP